MSASRLDAFALRLARRFRAPPRVVFGAWTESETLKRWWGPGGFTVPDCAVDLRPGGRFRIVMQPPDRAAHVLSGTYVTVEPPTRLVYTWTMEGTPEDDRHESLVTVEFRAVGNETEVILLQERLPGQRALDAHRAGWTGSLDRLEELVERAASGKFLLSQEAESLLPALAPTFRIACCTLSFDTPASRATQDEDLFAFPSTRTPHPE